MNKNIICVVMAVCAVMLGGTAMAGGVCTANPAVCGLADGYMRGICGGCSEPGQLNVKPGAGQIQSPSVAVNVGGGIASSGTTEQQRAYQTCIKAGGTPESCRMQAHLKPVKPMPGSGTAQAIDPAIQREWQAKVAPGAARYPDFASVVSRSQAQFSKFMYQCMTQSAHSADIAYYLGKNTADASRISGMSLYDTAIAIAEIELKVAPKGR